MKGQFVAGMVTVDKHPDHHGFTMGRRCIGRDWFTGGAVELGPVNVMLKGLTINGRVSQVKDKSRDMVGFEIAHYMQGCIKMAFMRKSQVRGQQRYLGQDVNSTELNHPMHNADEQLIIRGQVRGQGWGHVKNVVVVWSRRFFLQLRTAC